MTTDRELLEAANAVMAFQWSNTREAMDALTRLVDAAHEHVKQQAKPAALMWHHDETNRVTFTEMGDPHPGKRWHRTPLYAHPPQQHQPLDVALDQAACELLFKLMHPATPDSEEYCEVRLMLCDGHSGYGLYVASVDYPEEGALLLHGIKEIK